MSTLISTVPAIPVDFTERVLASAWKSSVWVWVVPSEACKSTDDNAEVSNFVSPLRSSFGGCAVRPSIAF
ncbi:hypothetical protein D3C73_1524030 [compost metagenome]